MDFGQCMNLLLAGKNLTEEQAGQAISAIMQGSLQPTQVAALLTAFHSKGETVDEIVGAAKAMISHAAKIENKPVGIIDTCGTGGDRSGTFNISTVSALVVASAGIPVAKHGNRSATSQCGSIDLLEKMGVNVMMSPEQISQCLQHAGMTVLFARVVHPAMKFAAPVRSELGFRTIFNYLGPLTNPARPSFQLVGVSSAAFLDTYASCLKLLGLERGWVLAASDGLDEITLSGPTQVAEITQESIIHREIKPEDAGLKPAEVAQLRGGTAEDNMRITLQILSGEEKGPKRDAILLNAGAALTIVGKTQTLKEGAEMAALLLETGRAAQVLEKLIQQSCR